MIDQRSINWGYFELLSSPPTTEPLFPNLRDLHCQYNQNTMSWLNLPLPSLTFLHVVFENPKLLQASLNSFPKFSRNIRRLFLPLKDDLKFGRIEPDYVYHLLNLSSVVARHFPLDMDDLVHLSLEFELSATLPCSDSPLSFSNLRHLRLSSKSLKQISQLLPQVRLPAITDFQTWIDDCPYRKELASFLASVLISNAGHIIKDLWLMQLYRWSSDIRSEAVQLGLEDLQPCMSFNNLRYLVLDVKCNVCLTDSELLTVTSAWPKLERLQINTYWGWNSQHGITPRGLVRLWQTCPLLSHIDLRLDTRGYTEVSPSETRESLRVALTFPPTVRISVVDAAIEAESVPAVITFFRGIAACLESRFWLSYWGNRVTGHQFQNAKEYVERWDEVRARVYGPRVYHSDFPREW